MQVQLQRIGFIVNSQAKCEDSRLRWFGKICNMVNDASIGALEIRAAFYFTSYSIS